MKTRENLSISLSGSIPEFLITVELLRPLAAFLILTESFGRNPWERRPRDEKKLLLFTAHDALGLQSSRVMSTDDEARLQNKLAADIEIETLSSYSCCTTPISEGEFPRPSRRFPNPGIIPPLPKNSMQQVPR